MRSLIVPGRHHVARADVESGRCTSCDARLTYGHPSSNVGWDSLKLTQQQVNQLLLAASEFDQFHADMVARAIERGEEPPAPASAVEFIDWAAPDLVPRRTVA